MKHPSFWDTLQQPVIGLAPMDGVTDAPNRTMHGLYGRPDVVITEFTNNVNNCIVRYVPDTNAFFVEDKLIPVQAHTSAKYLPWFLSIPKCFFSLAISGTSNKIIDFLFSLDSFKTVRAKDAGERVQ